MRITVLTSDIKKTIKKLNKVNLTAKDIKNLPALDNVYMVTSNDGIRLSKTNLSTTINAKINCEIEEHGRILIPGNTIKLIEKIKDDYVTITDEYIRSGKKEIKYIKGSLEEYPNMEYKEMNTLYFEVTEKELYRMLEVKYAIAQDEIRPILTGICFDNNKTIALDGFRMSVRESNEYNSTLDRVTVSKDAHETLYKLLNKKSTDKVKVYSTEDVNKHETTNIMFKFKDFEIIGRTMQEEYINYKQIIPDEFRTEVEINDIDTMIDELKFISEIAEGKSNLVKFDIKENENLKIAASNSENSINTEINSNTRGEELEIAFNNRYLIEGLKYYDNAKMQFISRVSCMVLKSQDDYNMNLELVLPIRLPA